jgi:hypothetical protein
MDRRRQGAGKSTVAYQLFGQRRAELETELRHLLRASSPEDRFCEQARDIDS